MKNVCMKVRTLSAHHPSAMLHLRNSMHWCRVCCLPSPHEPEMPAVHPKLCGRWKGGVSHQRPGVMTGGMVQALLACADERAEMRKRV